MQRVCLACACLVWNVTFPVLEAGTKPLRVTHIEVFEPPFPAVKAAVSVFEKAGMVFKTTSPVSLPVAPQPLDAATKINTPAFHAVPVPHLVVDPDASGQTTTYWPFLIAEKRANCMAPSNSLASADGEFVEKLGMANAATIATIASATISSIRVNPFFARKACDAGAANLPLLASMLLSEITMIFLSDIQQMRALPLFTG